MRLLLDTHVIVWLAHDRCRIPEAVLHSLRSADTVFVSFASAWEYGLTRNKRPHQLMLSFEDLLAGSPVEHIGIDYRVHHYAETLPLIHNDPFDRMLIAQALDLDLTLVTEDSDIRTYDVRTLW